MLEPIYRDQQQQPHPSELVMKTRCPEKEGLIVNFLLDVAAQAHIPQFIVDRSGTYFKKIKVQLAKKKIVFKDTAIASYALYETLSINNIPRTAREIEVYTQCEKSTLWAIESALNLRDTLNHPLDYVERFCTLLYLDFHEMKIIKGIVFNMFGFGAIRPQCVVAVVIYLFCKENKRKISLTQICEVCDVSTTNIYAITRKMDKRYVEKISLLYT